MNQEEHMAGTGVEMRMKILRDSATQQILKPLQAHGWVAEISREAEVGEYIIITATKSGRTKKVALMYSSATDNRHYKALDTEVDHIFTNGALYMGERFAYGIETPIAPIDEFFPLLIRWNKEFAPEVGSPPSPAQLKHHRVITAENPIDGVWARLSQFASSRLAEKLVRRRAESDGKTLPLSTVENKAEGVSFAIRNASDYFKSISAESLNKRILSLYYGTLALAFAEMLSSPSGPSDLDEVEGFTRYGHGLYTVQGTGDLGELNIGVLASGFFPRWISFLGHDTSHFPRAKAKSTSDIEKLEAGTVTTLRELFGAVPELSDLFIEVFDDAPSWIVPKYDNEANPSPGKCKERSTYIHLSDRSGRIALERVQCSPWPLTEIDFYSDKSGKRSFRARVDHPGVEYWYQALPIHHSPFSQSGSLIFPVFGVVSEYRALAMTILYTLSIIVRYMPSAWRRVEGGDWDQHLALIATSVRIFERLLPEQFLESITGEKVNTRQPGSFF